MEIQPNIALDEEQNESDLIIPAEARRCQVSAIVAWNQAVNSAIETAVKINPFQNNLPAGVVVPAVEAVDWTRGRQNCDIRPRLYDKASGQYRLVDSGSMITATARLPADKLDRTFKLVAVNGSQIATYGKRKINIKINRKNYEMDAVVCDINQDILGMDFLTKFKLGFEWDDTQTDLYIVDKKADIKSKLDMVTVPTDLQRLSYLKEPDGVRSPRDRVSSQSNESTLFQVSCVKKLSPENKKIKSAEEGLKLHAEEYANLLRRFPKLLSPSFSKEEPVHGVYHRIDTDPDKPPCKAKRRPIPLNSTKAAAGKAAWDKMIEEGVIERVKADTKTEFTSALHLADKAGGGVRPCSDFRKLNEMTVADSYPLPLLRDFTSKIHGAKYFSVIDIRSAFFNIPIWPDHRFKTATLSPWGGVYIYNRLPFGLTSGPASWQKLLEVTLQGIDNLFIYLDDVLLWAESKEEHDKLLEEVFDRLSKNNMALSLEKCKFFQTSVSYLGYSVTKSGIRPLPAKLQALRDFKAPACQKDVLHFCGALNYFRTSLRGVKRNGKIKSAAEVLQPLYAIGTDKLQKKDFKKIWENSPVLQQAFNEAKEMVMEAVELVHPHSNYPLALFTDASDHSVGGSLQMLGPDGQFKPLGFYSAHLNPAQKKYSVFKKELLGAFKALRHFLPEVYGKHLSIYTDHLPLQQAFESSSIPLNDPQVYRQIIEISRFTRDVRHVAGVDNIFADFLSRIPDSKKGTIYLDSSDPDTLELAAASEVASAESVQFQLTSVHSIKELQESCPEIKKIKSGDKPKNAIFGNAFFGEIELFCELSSKNPRPYVPEGLRSHILTTLHSIDHIGAQPTIKRVTQEYYWPALKHDAKLYTQICNTCKKVKAGQKLVNTGDFQVPDKRFSHVMVDIVGPLPPSQGYKYLLTAICRTSRYLQAIPLREATSAEAASGFLHHWVAHFGLPGLVTSDNGASFLSNVWKGMMDKLHIDVQYSALYRPESIGMLERQHRSLKDSLKSAIVDMGEKYQGEWMDYLPFILLGRRTAVQTDIGASSSELAFGTTVKVPGQILLDPGEALDTLAVKNLLGQVKNKTNIPAHQPSNHSRPEKEFKEIPLNVTHVYTRQHKKTGLQCAYEGPFKIHERLSRSTFKIEVGRYHSGEPRFEIRHANDLKLAHPKSMAAEAQRPKLGRPTSSSSGGSSSTEASPQPSPAKPVSSPPSTALPVEPSSFPSEKQTNADPNSNVGGKRPARSTRNPNPTYVDSLEIMVTGPPPFRGFG